MSDHDDPGDRSPASVLYFFKMFIVDDDIDLLTIFDVDDRS